MSAMSELAADADRLARLNGLPTRYSARAGDVCDYGLPMHPAFVPELLAAYRRSARSGDWWGPEAGRLAVELEAAMRDAGLNPQNKEAA